MWWCCHIVGFANCGVSSEAVRPTNQQTELKESYLKFNIPWMKKSDIDIYYSIFKRLLGNFSMTLINWKNKLKHFVYFENFFIMNCYYHNAWAIIIWSIANRSKECLQYTIFKQKKDRHSPIELTQKNNQTAAKKMVSKRLLLYSYFNFINSNCLPSFDIHAQLFCFTKNCGSCWSHRRTTNKSKWSAAPLFYTIESSWKKLSEMTNSFCLFHLHFHCVTASEEEKRNR